jgi:predicted ArsR family transcriptional regulator
MPATTTKTETIQKLLARKGGASIAQLQAATDWQPHSVRAALSGLRKKGATVARATNARGVTIYRLSNEAD